MNKEEYRLAVQGQRDQTIVYYSCIGCGATTHSFLGSKRLEKRMCVTCFITSPYFQSSFNQKSKEAKE